MEFTENVIQALFGHEAAEDEDIERLKSYYLKGRVFDQIITDLPLRILVGHKGVGKSALFQVAMSEDRTNNKLSILIQPDDIVDLGIQDDFLATIREWKIGLSKIIIKKFLKYLNLKETNLNINFETYDGDLIEFLKDIIKESLSKELISEESLILSHFSNKSKIYIYLDDLDRGWKGRDKDITKISALLNAVRDLSREHKGLYFRIGLRSDVYYLVRTSDESTDKIEGSVTWLSWSNHEIYVLLIKRIETYFGREVDEKLLMDMKQHELSKYLKPIFELVFQGYGNWKAAPIHQVLLSLIRKRPRDLIKLCTLAARNAQENNNQIITTSNLDKVFENYSQGRLQDTINEYSSELKDIERLIINMKPNKREKNAKLGYSYTSSGLLEKIKNIEERGKFTFANNKEADPKDLAAFLYKINFLTARKQTENGIERKYFEENRYLSNSFSDFGFDWEVHPAYRWALQPDDIQDIFKNLEVSSE